MRRQAAPVLVAPSAGAVSRLQRVELRETGQYDEAWLQALIHEQPGVLPLWEIEPAVREAVPVCRELPLPSGYLDNLLVTPHGDLVLVECKLWRNPQARREVVAQVIDYAKDLQRLDYAGLEAAIGSARGDRSARLYGFVEAQPEAAAEADFVDAVSRNLRRGRALLLIAGDGITESVEAIADYLQQHAGMHFTLALVELAVYALPDGGLLVVPSIPLRTVNIVRGIVNIRDDRVEVAPPPESAQARRATTLTEEEFLAGLDAERAGTAERLLALVAQGEDLGLHIEAKKLLQIRLPLGDDACNVLSIWPNGGTLTQGVWGLRDRIGEPMIRRYLEEVARVVGGILGSAPIQPNVRMKDTYLRIWNVLDHGDEWLEVTRRFRDEVFAALESARSSSVAPPSS